MVTLNKRSVVGAVLASTFLTSSALADNDSEHEKARLDFESEIGTPIFTKPNIESSSGSDVLKQFKNQINSPEQRIGKMREYVPEETEIKKPESKGDLPTLRFNFDPSP